MALVGLHPFLEKVSIAAKVKASIVDELNKVVCRLEEASVEVEESASQPVHIIHSGVVMYKILVVPLEDHLEVRSLQESLPLPLRLAYHQERKWADADGLVDVVATKLALANNKAIDPVDTEPATAAEVVEVIDITDMDLAITSFHLMEMELAIKVELHIMPVLMDAVNISLVVIHHLVVMLIHIIITEAEAAAEFLMEHMIIINNLAEVAVQYLPPIK